MMRVLLLVSALAAAACGRAENTREYTLVGQIVSIAPERREVTIKHDDIEGFMPGMTMPFTVRDAALLEGRTPGDLVTATLVYSDTSAHLSSITRTGYREVDAAPSAERGLREGELLPDATFVDERGATRKLSDLRGHRAVVTFIYTRCPVPDFCPLMNRNFAQLQDAVRGRADLSDVRLLSVTLDPAYDTPPVLAKHARVFRADPAIWSFLTGEPPALRDFASQFGIYSEVDPDQPDEIVHSLRTAVIGADGRLVSNTAGNEWKPGDILAQLEKAAAPRH